MIRVAKCLESGGHGSKKSTRKSKSSDSPIRDPRQDIEAILCWQGTPQTKTAGTNTTHPPRRTKPKQGLKKFPKSKCTGDGEDLFLPDCSGKCPTLEEVQQRLNLILDLDLQDLGSEAPKIEDKALLEAFRNLLENKEVKEAVDHWIKLQLPHAKIDEDSSSDEKSGSGKDTSTKEQSIAEKYLSYLKGKQKKTKNVLVPRCQGQLSLVQSTPQETTTKKIRRECTVGKTRGSTSEESIAKSQGRGTDETAPSGAVSVAASVAASVPAPSSAASRRSSRASRPPRVLAKVRSRRVLAPRTLLLPPRRTWEGVPMRFLATGTTAVGPSGSDSDQPISSVPGCPPTPVACRSQCTSRASLISKRTIASDRTANHHAASYVSTTHTPSQAEAHLLVTHKSASRCRYSPRRKRRHQDVSSKIPRSTKSSHRVKSDSDSSIENSRTRHSEHSRKTSKKLHIRMPDVIDNEPQNSCHEIGHRPDSATTVKNSSSPDESRVSSATKNRRLKKVIRSKPRFTSANTQTSKHSHKTNATQTHHGRQKPGTERHLDKLAEACRMLVEELHRRDEAASNVHKQEIAQQTEPQQRMDAEVNTIKERHSKSHCPRHGKSNGGEKHKKCDNSKCSQTVQTDEVDNPCIIPFLRSTNEGEAAFSLLKLTKGMLVPLSSELMSIPCSPDLQNINAAPPLQGDAVKEQTFSDQVTPKLDENSPVILATEPLNYLHVQEDLTSEQLNKLNFQHVEGTPNEQLQFPERSELSEPKCLESQYIDQNADDDTIDEALVKQLVLNLDETNDWSPDDAQDGFPIDTNDLSSFTCLKSVPTDEHFERYVVFSNHGSKYPVAQVSVAKRNSSPRSTHSVGRSTHKSIRDSKVSRTTSISRVGSEVRFSQADGVLGTQTEPCDVCAEAGTAAGTSRAEGQGSAAAAEASGDAPCYCDASTYYGDDAEATLGEGFIDAECECDTYGENGPGAGQAGFYGGAPGGYGEGSSPFGQGAGGGSCTCGLSGPGGGGMPFGGGAMGQGGGPPCTCSPTCVCQCCCSPTPQEPPRTQRRHFSLRNVAPGELPSCQIPPSFPSPRPALKLVNDLGPMQGPCGRAPFAPPPIIPCSGPPTNMGSIFGPCPKHGDVPVVPTLVPCPGVSGPVVSQDDPCTCDTWNNWNNFSAGTPCTCGRAQCFCQMQQNNNTNNNRNNNLDAYGLPSMYCQSSSHRVPAEKENDGGRPPANFFRDYCEER